MNKNTMLIIGNMWLISAWFIEGSLNKFTMTLVGMYFIISSLTIKVQKND